MRIQNKTNRFYGMNSILVFLLVLFLIGNSILIQVKLHCIRFFVLDEADRMLSQDSFQTDIVSLVKRPGFPSVSFCEALMKFFKK